MIYLGIYVKRIFSFYLSWWKSILLEIWGLSLSKRWVISYQASRSCRPLVITASSSGTEDQLGRGLPEMVHTKTHQVTSPLTETGRNFMMQQLTVTWVGRLNILHSAARKSLFYTKRGLAGCICRMSHLPAHIVETYQTAHIIRTYTRNTTLPHWRTIKSTCQGSTNAELHD